MQAEAVVCWPAMPNNVRAWLECGDLNRTQGQIVPIYDDVIETVHVSNHEAATMRQRAANTREEH